MLRFLTKLAALTAVLTVGSHQAGAQPQIEFKSRELQEGRHYVQKLTAVLAAGEMSGQASYRYDIDVPAANGVTPEVALVYGSGAGYSEIAWGWELTIPTIERSPQHGVPTYTSSDTFQYRDGLSATKLVPTGNTASDGSLEYREESERSFSRYLFNTATDSWTILRTNGVRLELGTDAISRRGTGILTTSGTAAWLVREISETHGNYADYLYTPDGAGNARLIWIHYGGNKNTGLAPNYSVHFVWDTFWGANSPVPASYRSGYRRVFGQDELSQIVVQASSHAVTAGNPAQIPTSSPTTRTYTIDHGDPSAIATNAGFYVHQIYVSGPGLLQAEPPIQFTYSAPWNPNGGVVDSATAISIIPGPNDPYDPFPANPQNGEPAQNYSIISSAGTTTASTLADVTGDGRPDVVDITACSQGYWTIWRNASYGPGISLTSERWALPAPATGTPQYVQCALQITSGAEVSQDYFDINGDSYPDIVYLYGTNTIVCPGTGSGFAACEPWGNVPLTRGTLREYNNTYTHFQITTRDLLDLNGDGLVDSVTAGIGDQSQPIAYVQFNTGSGWTQSVTISLPQCGLAGQISCLRLTEDIDGTLPTFDGQTYDRVLVNEIRDLNGDGLPDFATSLQVGQVQVNWGTGYGFADTSVSLGSGIRALGLGYDNLTAGTPEHEYEALYDLVDVNGDGLPDSVELLPSDFPQNVRVHFNYGGVWDTAEQDFQLYWDSSLDSYERARLSYEYSYSPSVGSGYMVGANSWVDMNADGLPDFVSSLLPTGLPQAPSLLMHQLSYRPPRAMTTATSLSGNHTFSVTYAPYKGSSGDPIPFAIHTASQTARSRTPLYSSEPSRYTSLTTAFTYGIPAYDRTRREFLGFATVWASDVDFGQVQQTNYFTDYYRAGLVQSHFVGNVTAASTSRQEVNDYSLVPECPGSYFPRLDEHHVLEGTFVDHPTTYAAYNAYGMPLIFTDSGSLSIATDDIQHTRTYAVRDDLGYRLVLPSRDSATSNGKYLGATNRYYDDRTNLGATPTFGDLVEVEREKSPGVFVTTQRYFDAYGNVTSAIDEENYTTTHTYDATYHQFPVSTSTSIGKIYKSFHALTGDVADRCGPQNSGSTWNCSRTEIDYLGRVTATWVPTLTNNVYAMTNLKSIAYGDFAYPLWMSVSTHHSDGTDGVSFQYRDGFGNPTEIRTEESSGVYRVYEAGYDAYGYPIESEQIRREQTSGYTHSPIGEPYLYDHDYVRGAIEKVTDPRGPRDHRTPPTATRITTLAGSKEIVTTTDEDGYVAVGSLDGFGRIASVLRQGGADGNALTTYSYDGNGFLTQVTDPNQLSTIYSRNLLGWTTGVTAPDGSMRTTQFNNRGQPIVTTDARGVIVNDQRDAAGRLTRILSSNEPPKTGYVYVRHVDATLSYYGNESPSQMGWLKTEYSDHQAYTYSYGPGGQVASEVITNGQGSQGTLGFLYTPDGRLDTVSYPDGWNTHYSYNLDDSVSNVVVPSTGFSLASYLYDDNGKPSVVMNDAGLSEDFTYDVRGRLQTVASTNTAVLTGNLVDDRLTWSSGHQVVELDRYGIDANGNVRTSPDVFVMTHDGLGRLTNVTKNGNSYAAYTYDVGGRLLQHDVDPGTQATTYDADKLISRNFGTTSNTYTYDAAGNVLHDEHLVDGAVQSFHNHEWDALGRYFYTYVWRTSQTQEDTTYFYTASGAIARVTNPTELSVNKDVFYFGNWSRKDMISGAFTDSVIVNGKDVLEATGGAFEMPHRTYDQTVLAVSNGSGQVVRQEEFKPYGHRIAGSAAGLFEEHYQGIRTDDVVVAGGRAYEPDRGAWLARDPLPLATPESVIRNPNLPNLYGFDDGDPLSKRDPSGRCSEGAPSDCPDEAEELAAEGITLLEEANDYVEKGFEEDAEYVRDVFTGGPEGEVPEASSTTETGEFAEDTTPNSGVSTSHEQAAEKAETAQTNGNSLASEKAQHVYEVEKAAKGTTETYKYGVSGSPLNAEGVSSRMSTQVSALNRAAAASGSGETYSAYVVDTVAAGPGARAAALNIEYDLVREFAELFGQPEGNVKPTP